MDWLKSHRNVDGKWAKETKLVFPDLEEVYQSCWNKMEEIDPKLQQVLPLGKNDYICEARLETFFCVFSFLLCGVVLGPYSYASPIFTRHK